MAQTYVQVLIVGAGPSGLMVADLLSRCGIDNFRIIDSRARSPKLAGQSHSLSSRALELLQILGLQHEIDKKANRVREYTFWESNNEGELSRLNTGPDTINPTRFPWTLFLDKRDVEEVLAGDLENRGHVVEHSMELLHHYSSGSASLVAQIRNNQSGVVQLWRATYILGCDGPESCVRKAAGVTFEHYGSLDCWAVVNTTVETNLPDIRRRCTIRSPSGNCVLTPRKGDEVVCISTLLSSSDLEDEAWDINGIQYNALTSQCNASPMSLAQAIQDRISESIMPYWLSIKHISWISQHYIQKGLARHFSASSDRVFLLGSACHVHSPLTKQSMNGGMLDAWNLAWKLALVSKGGACPSLLATYETERRTVLRGALELDSKFDHVFAACTDKSVLVDGFHNFDEASGYTSGCGIRYPASFLVKKEARLFLMSARETLTPGKRLLPLTLTRHIDGNEVDTLDAMPPDGRFNLVLFVGHLLDAPIVKGLANFLISPESPLKCTDSVLDDDRASLNIFLIHCTPHFSVSISGLPQPFPEYAWNIFEDMGERSHRAVGVSPALGAICLLRPDGYIALVTNLDDSGSVRKYMEGVFLSLTDEGGIDGLRSC